MKRDERMKLETLHKNLTLRLEQLREKETKLFEAGDVEGYRIIGKVADALFEVIEDLEHAFGLGGK